MTKEWRTLKLEILAETKQFLDDLKKSEKQTESFGEKMADFGKKAALAFAAFGAAVATASVAFAKAAAEDEAAANKLAQTLASVTNATSKQIAAVNQYITQTSLATGITDDQLRPAFERLARSTKSVQESQTLLNLALDLSAATGKPLEAVTNALAKAYDGSYTSLQRLGLGIDANLIKSKDFDAIYKQLNSTFGEFSEKRSEETIVKFQRLQVALQEAKEAVGAALLPIFVKLGDWLIKVGVPNLSAFVAGLTGDRGFAGEVTKATQGAFEFGEKIKSIITTIYNLKEELAVLGTVIATVFVASKIAAFISVIQGLVTAFVAWRTAAAGAAVATAAATGGVSLGATAAGIAGAIGLLAAAGIFLKGGGDGMPSNLGTAGTLGPVGGTSGFGGGTTSGGFGGATGGGGGGTTAGGGVSLGGFGSINAMVDRLTQINEEIGTLTFKYNTGQISKAQAQTALNSLKKEMANIESITGRLSQQQMMMGSPTATISGGVSRGEYGGITINVNAPSAIDQTGFSRAVIDALNSVERRQGGGASQLVGL